MTTRAEITAAADQDEAEALRHWQMLTDAERLRIIDVSMLAAGDFAALTADETLAVKWLLRAIVMRCQLLS